MPSRLFSYWFSLFSLQLSSESLLWRAVLQTLILEHAPHLPKQEQQVGRIAAKAKNFPHYTQMAFKKLNLDLKVSDESTPESWVANTFDQV